MVFLFVFGAAILAVLDFGYIHRHSSEASAIVSENLPPSCAHKGVVDVTVAFDRAWAEASNDRATDRALRVVASSSEIYAPYCLEFRVTRTKRWSPKDAPASINDLFNQLGLQLRPRKGQLLIYFTGLSFQEQIDGLEGNDIVVVRDHPDDPRMNVVVTAHEQGHFLGFRNNQEACGCLMDASSTSTSLSAHHTEELTEASRARGGPIHALKVLTHVASSS